MNNAGITTQYGFLFQRKAFILFALENAGTKQTFTFEGRDDIEISADESIYSVKSADASFIAFCIKYESNISAYKNRSKDFVDVFFKNISLKLSAHYDDIELILHFVDILKNTSKVSINGDYIELTYEVAMKKVGLLEHIFTILSREINTDRLHELEIKTAQLKKEIKSLKSAFDQSKVKKFNNRLTELYLSSGLNIKHLKEDLQDNDFSLEFDPFRLCLFATHKEQDQLTRFMPGSMTRQTHLQMLTYLCMFEYLKDNFRDFIYLPILIIDSANQPMGIEIFKEVYPTITQLADSIGVQTIFMSKDRLDNIPEDDFIDISAGLNKFHKKS